MTSAILKTGKLYRVTEGGPRARERREDFWINLWLPEGRPWEHPIPCLYARDIFLYLGPTCINGVHDWSQEEILFEGQVWNLGVVEEGDVEQVNT